MTREVCPTCGLEKIGGRCLTRWCDDRHPSVDDVLGDQDDHEPEVRTDGGHPSSGTEQHKLGAFRQARITCISGGETDCDFEVVVPLLDVETATRIHAEGTGSHLPFERELVTSTDSGNARSLQPGGDR